MSNFDQLVEAVEKWADDRNLIAGSRPKDQVSKLLEEFGELASGINKNNIELIQDSLGDMLVVMIIIAKMYEQPLEECLTSAYIEIKDRKGKMIDGVFVKESDIA